MFMMVVGKMIIIIIKITRGREGAFNNYVDQILPNFDPTPLEWTKIGRITYFLPFVTCPTLGFPLTQTPLFLST